MKHFHDFCAIVICPQTLPLLFKFILSVVIIFSASLTSNYVCVCACKCTCMCVWCSMFVCFLPTFIHMFTSSTCQSPRSVLTSLILCVNFFTAAQLPPSSGFFLGKCALYGMCVGMTCTVVVSAPGMRGSCIR